MKKIIGLVILSLFLVGCLNIPKDVYVGKVEEIKTISAGGFGTNDKALVILDNGKEIVVSQGVSNMEIGSEVWTANQYSFKYRIKIK